MAQERDIITDMCKREIDAHCFSPTINDISIYSYIKRTIRLQELKRNGFPQSEGKSSIKIGQQIKYFFCSLYQVIKLLVLNKKYKHLIYSFFRIDKVNGIYMDKFTDPLIDYTSIHESCVIFDKGNNGVHPQNRMHKEKIVYTDAINIFSYIWAVMFSFIFKLKYKGLLTELWKNVDTAYPELKYNKSVCIRTILYLYTLTKVYSLLMRRMDVKCMFAPARHAFLPLIPAAKKSNVTVLELQHGITYNESLTYSGYRDKMFTPDYFFTFGEMTPSDVYGIDESKMVNIGWAFAEYIKDNIDDVEVDETGVLVISEPHVTQKVLNAVLTLADENKAMMFYFRPHPLEKLSVEQLSLIDHADNIKLDDNSQSVLATLKRYYYVIGENSTVLYEALSLGKKVGKMKMMGLNPIYLQPEDEEMFWTIVDDDSFKKFLEETTKTEKKMSIYSRFEKREIESLITNINNNQIRP